MGAYASESQTWHRAIALISSGRVNPELIITHKLPLIQAEEGFRLAISKEAAKVLFIP